MNYKALGRRIKEERIKLNLTQEQLAEACEVSPAFVGHIERGERSVSLPTLVKIVNRLGVTFDYLLSDSVTPKDEEIINEFRQLIDTKPLKTKRAVIDILRTTLKYLK